MRSRGFALVSIVLLAARAAWAASPPPCGGDFVGGVSYSADSSIAGLSAIDVNHDGFPDLVQTANSPAEISVRLGAADGSFGAPIGSPTNVEAFASLLGNFTNPSFPDVVISTYGNLMLAAGNGDGTFRAPTALTVPVLGAMSAGDFDGDGKLDLIGSPPEGGLAVYLGNGSGSFGPPIRTVTESVYVLATAVGDLNGDGLPDVVAIYPNLDFASVFLGTGGGSFAEGSTLLVGSGLSSVTIADVNGDGKPDVVLGIGNYVAVALGNGDG